jgi:hypothetical protein
MVSMATICADIKNYFLKDKVNPETCIYEGDYTISNGTVAPSNFLKEGQYFRICGSDLNDGVYLNTTEGREKLRDETFSGTIWKMSVPQDFIELCQRIDEWATINGAANSANMSTFNSESFGNYSYSKGASGTGKSGVTGAALTWQTVFYDELTPYRREFVL